jgi:hypothetical protein
MIQPSLLRLAGTLVSVMLTHPTAMEPRLAANEYHGSSSNLPYESPFKTGYEPDEATGTPADAHTWIVFDNTSSLPPSEPFALSVFYQTPGDVSDRYARIIDDPTHADNKVLHYWLRNAVIDTGYQGHLKGRIQTGFPAPLEDVTELYARQRLFVHDDVNHILDYPTDGDPWWISVTIQELWFGANWLGHPNPARITLLMYPDGDSMRLALICDTTVDFTLFWQAVNPEFALPVGEWVTVEIAYKMGDSTSGRMVVVVTEELTGSREVVFNVTNWTYNPSADDEGGTGPVPLTHWNPQKIYSSDNVLHFIRDSGGVAQLYWDDFEFSSEWPPGFPSDSVPAISEWGLAVMLLLCMATGTLVLRRPPVSDS